MLYFMLPQLQITELQLVSRRDIHFAVSILLCTLCLKNVFDDPHFIFSCQILDSSVSNYSGELFGLRVLHSNLKIFVYISRNNWPFFPTNPIYIFDGISCQVNYYSSKQLNIEFYCPHTQKITVVEIHFSQFTFTGNENRSNKIKVRIINLFKVKVKFKMEQLNVAELKDSKPEKPQLPKSKVFEIIEKYFAIAGITPSLAEQTCPLNGCILLGFLLLGSAMYFTSVFLIDEAETFAEYTQSVYTNALSTLIILALLILIFKVKQLFKFINDCDKLAKISE